jgi:hypothetical protein
MAHAHDDAVRGRTAHGEGAFVDRPHAQGLVQGERVAGARLVGFRGKYPDVLAELTGDLAQRVQARRVDAVIVGE